MSPISCSGLLVTQNVEVKIELFLFQKIRNADVIKQSLEELIVLAYNVEVT